MFTVTYRATPRKYTNNQFGEIDLRFNDLEMFDATRPSFGADTIITFSNGGGAHAYGYTQSTKPIFEYQPFKGIVRIFIYGKAGNLAELHEYDKLIACGDVSQLHSEYLWKKLYIPFSFENGEFKLDKKKFRNKKTREVSIMDWINDTHHYSTDRLIAELGL